MSKNSKRCPMALKKQKLPNKQISGYETLVLIEYTHPSWICNAIQKIMTSNLRNLTIVVSQIFWR